MIKNKKNKGILSFRTKAEVILVAFLLIGITTVSVMSVTRTITDSSDTVYTYIRNSNGNYWAATGANLQTAIWDLNSSDGGEVHVPPGNYTFSSNLTIDNFVTVIGTGTGDRYDHDKNTCINLQGDASVVIIDGKIPHHIMMPASKGEKYWD